MAANLKVFTFRFTKWGFLIISLCLVISVYFKQKLDLFWEQCRPAEEEKPMAGWMSVLTDMWGSWRLILWPWSHNWQRENKPASDDDAPVPPSCQAVFSEVTSHVVMTYIVSDINHLFRIIALFIMAFCVDMQDKLSMMGREGKVILVSIFDNFTDLLQKIFENLQRGFHSVWINAVETNKKLIILLPDSFGIVIMSIICILCLSFGTVIGWRKYKIKQVRNKFPQNTYQSNKTSPASNNFMGSLNSRVLELRSDIVQRFAADCAVHGISQGHGHVQQETHKDVNKYRRAIRPLTMSLVYMVGVLLCVSVPWEFCRLYQLAIANKAAVASAGVPLECSTEPLSFLQTLTLWLSRQLAWSHGNPCDRYYQAMFVDPLWEITPFMVLTSMLTRSVIHPAEMLAAGLGSALRQFFTEIPLHWQPVCMLLIVTFTFMVLLLSCSYRFSIPLLLRMEPKTPVLTCDEQSHTTIRAGGCEREGGGHDDNLRFPCRAKLAFGKTVDGDSSPVTSHQRMNTCRPQNLGRSDRYQCGRASPDLFDDGDCSLIQDHRFNIEASRGLPRTGHLQRNVSSHISLGISNYDPQKERQETKGRKDTRGRQENKRNPSSGRTGYITSRVALQDADKRSNRDRSSVVDAGIK